MAHAQIRCEPKRPKGDVAFDSSLSLVLNHLDLSPSNIVVDNNSRIWLIDWEHAGFYPQWFEYTAMCQADWDGNVGFSDSTGHLL